MPNYTPTADEIQCALQHIRYEIEAFISVPVHDRTDPHLVESVLFRRMAHARALLDFFTACDRLKDNILSSDYGFAHSPIFSPKDDSAVRRRLNKHLMHLTYSRVRLPAEDKQWPVERIFPPIRSACEAFIEHLLSSAAMRWPDGERPKWEALRGGIAAKSLSMAATANVACQVSTTIHKASVERI